MLSESEKRFLEVIKGWMDEPHTKTYLLDAGENVPGFERCRRVRMSDELKTELLRAGVEPPINAGT